MVKKVSPKWHEGAKKGPKKVEGKKAKRASGGIGGGADLQLQGNILGLGFEGQIGGSGKANLS